MTRGTIHLSNTSGQSSITGDLMPMYFIYESPVLYVKTDGNDYTVIGIKRQ